MVIQFFKYCFIINLRHGKGILYDGNGRIVYDGDFINDKLDGEGRFNYDNGACYIGQFKKSLKHGRGVLCGRNGDIIYQGDFYNDYM